MAEVKDTVIAPDAHRLVTIEPWASGYSPSPAGWRAGDSDAGNWKIDLVLTVKDVFSLTAYCEHVRREPPKQTGPPSFTWQGLKPAAMDAMEVLQCDGGNYFSGPFPVKTMETFLATHSDWPLLAAPLLAARIQEELAWVETGILAAMAEQPFAMRKCTPAWDDFQARALSAESTLNELFTLFKPAER